MPRHSYCSVPGCPEDATHKGKCGVHSGQNDQKFRVHERRAVYDSKAWKEFRLRRLVLNPICEVCEKQLANEVHHIEALADGTLKPEEIFTIEGTMCACKSCHSRLTMGEVMERKKG